MLTLLGSFVTGPGIIAADASASLSGTTVFVSPNGDDGRTGATSAEAVREIQRAVELAPAGATIQIAAGSYQSFVIQGRNDLQIVGKPGATVSDGRYDRRASVAIASSERITVEGLSLSNSLWGVKVEASKTIILKNLDVTDIGQEAIHIHRYSSDVVVSDSQISDTGRRGGQFARYGEGIYVGTGSGLNDDDTNNIRILRNNISRTTSEAIDIKQTVYNVLVEGNYVHDINTNTSGAVVVGVGVRSYRNPDVLIRGNIFWNISSNSQWLDGNAISLSAAATVEANVIWNTEHFGILMDGNFVSPTKTVTLRNNVVFQTGRDPIGQWSTPSPAQPQLVNNLTAGQATDALGSEPRPTADSPGANVIQLRDNLVADLGGAPVQQPTPSPTIATTTPPAASPSTELPSPERSATTTSPRTVSTTTTPRRGVQANPETELNNAQDSIPTFAGDDPGAFSPSEMTATGLPGNGPRAAVRVVREDHQQRQVAEPTTAPHLADIPSNDAAAPESLQTDPPSQLAFSDSPASSKSGNPLLWLATLTGMLLILVRIGWAKRLS